MNVQFPPWTLGSIIAIVILITVLILALLYAVGVLTGLPFIVILILFGALALARLT